MPYSGARRSGRKLRITLRFGESSVEPYSRRAPFTSTRVTPKLRNCWVRSVSWKPQGGRVVYWMRIPRRSKQGLKPIRPSTFPVRM